MASSGKITKQELDPNVFSGMNGINAAIYDTPGNSEWTCPEGVTKVLLTMFGGGGSGAAIGPSTAYSTNLLVGGGYGGAFVVKKMMNVVPGQKYPLVVGSGGLGNTSVSVPAKLNGNPGTDSSGFGLTCPGGIGGDITDQRNSANGVFYTNVIAGKRARGNNKLINAGTIPAVPLDSNVSFELSFLPLTYTQFGRAGIPKTFVEDSVVTNTVFMAGGAGYGEGGDADGVNQNHIGNGAGSGAAYGKPTLNGGDGIIIIEW